VSDGVTISLQGLDKLFERVQELGRRGARIEAEALKAGAEIIREEAAKRAPRSTADKQHMADNIQISGIKTKNGHRYVQVGPTRGDHSQFFYAKFIEFGTSKMPARPFLGPAASEKEREVRDKIAEVLARGLQS
jgi:HK97 gp10 family phage protein